MEIYSIYDGFNHNVINEKYEILIETIFYVIKCWNKMKPKKKKNTLEEKFVVNGMDQTTI